MGRRGPRPEPTALKLLKGNPGKRPLNAREPKPVVARPDPPDHLDEEARREWDRRIADLELLGLVTRLDGPAFAAYCQVYSRWVYAEGKLREFGPVIKSPNGFPILSPYLTIANTALKQMYAFLCEFGMSPASRTRIETSEPPVVPRSMTGTHGKNASRFFD